MKKEEKLLPDVKYELAMANWSARAIKKEGDAAANNAFLEAFLVHSRNIFQFLTLARQNGNQELLAKHYAAKWSPLTARKAMPTLQKFIPKMDDYLLNLSYNRLKSKPKWPVAKILKEVNSGWKKFEAVSAG